MDLRNTNKDRHITPFGELPEILLEKMTVVNNNRGRTIASNNRVYFMVLGIERHEDKYRFFLEMTFPIHINPRLVTKEHGFMYRWNKKRTTIRRLLGTTKPDVIERQARLLLKECQRFYFMYNTRKKRKRSKNKMAAIF